MSKTDASGTEASERERLEAYVSECTTTLRRYEGEIVTMRGNLGHLERTRDNLARDLSWAQKQLEAMRHGR